MEAGGLPTEKIIELHFLQRQKMHSKMSESRSCPLNCRKTPFWNVGQTLHSSKVIPKVIYYIVSYSINIVVGIISSYRYWKM